MFDQHAIEQLHQRFQFLPEEKRASLALNALRVAGTFPNDDIAVKLWRVKGAKKKHNESNGNQIWAIIRGGSVKTFMLRRRTQGNNLEDFHVNKIINNIGELEC